MYSSKYKCAMYCNEFVNMLDEGSSNSISAGVFPQGRMSLLHSIKNL